MNEGKDISETINNIRNNIQDRDANISKSLYRTYSQSVYVISVLGIIVNIIVPLIVISLNIEMSRRKNMQDKTLIPVGALLVMSSKDVAQLKTNDK